MIIILLIFPLHSLFLLNIFFSFQISITIFSRVLLALLWLREQKKNCRVENCTIFQSEEHTNTEQVSQTPKYFTPSAHAELKRAIEAHCMVEPGEE